ncbi:MAG: cupin protein [Daejeonella sp.]|nr:cupin protein [Daejeonella sp.]
MIKSIKNADHYTWGTDCDGWHLLKTESLSVIQERMPIGTKESTHLHNKSQQLFFVLSGVASFVIDGQCFVVKSNERIHVKPLSIHSISKRGVEELKFLVISEPMAHGDRIEIC